MSASIPGLGFNIALFMVVRILYGCLFVEGIDLRVVDGGGFFNPMQWNIGRDWSLDENGI